MQSSPWVGLSCNEPVACFKRHGVSCKWHRSCPTIIERLAAPPVCVRNGLAQSHRAMAGVGSKCVGKLSVWLAVLEWEVHLTHYTLALLDDRSCHSCLQRGRLPPKRPSGVAALTATAATCPADSPAPAKVWAPLRCSQWSSHPLLARWHYAAGGLACTAVIRLIDSGVILVCVVLGRLLPCRAWGMAKWHS